MKINDNRALQKLREAMSAELERRAPFLPQRKMSTADRRRHGLAISGAQRFVAILENHVMDRTASMVKAHLSVGLGNSGGVLYAWAAVKLSQYGSVIDMFDALFLLGKELEKYLFCEQKLDNHSE